MKNHHTLLPVKTNRTSPYGATGQDLAAGRETIQRGGELESHTGHALGDWHES
jgi:hypothetical protein